MKTREEMEAIKAELNALDEKLRELTEEEMEQLAGGKRFGLAATPPMDGGKPVVLGGIIVGGKPVDVPENGKWPYTAGKWPYTVGHWPYNDGKWPYNDGKHEDNG